MPARSRPVQCREPTGSQSTTSCSAFTKNSATPPCMKAGKPSDGRNDSEQSACWRLVSDTQVVVRQFGRHATAGSALQKPDLKQIRLVYILDGIDFFAQNGGDGIYAYRAPAES